MDMLMNAGVQLTAQLQTLQWLEMPMRFFSLLGSADFFFMVLPAVYWCIDSRLGIRIGLILLASVSLNDLAKLALHEPRPYWISAQVKALAADPSFGIPSGHAQNAVALWGTLAASIRQRWAWVTAAALIGLISISRIYLGLHFPHDVLLGWVIGILLLWGFLALWEPVGRWFAQRKLRDMALVFLAVPAVMLLADAMLVRAQISHGLPAEWLSNALRAGGEPPPHVSMESMLNNAGVFIGFAFGLVWIRTSGGFRVSGTLGQRLACFVIGLAGVLALYIGVKALLPSLGEPADSIVRVVRYGLIGLWVSAGAPALFRRLRLAAAQNTTG